MDYLNFVIALDEEFQANIPESEYTKFITLNACVEQLGERASEMSKAKSL